MFSPFLFYNYFLEDILKKLLLLSSTLVMLLLLLCSCECKHKEYTEASCLENGVCLKCGEIMQEATGHTVSDWIVQKEATCTEDGLLCKKCLVCDNTFLKTQIIPATSHTVVIDKAVAATCTTTGLTEGKHCSVCDTVLVEQIVVKAKDHTEVIDKAVAATCTTDGKTEGKHCSVCNTVLVEQTAIKAKGHTEVIDKAVAATCTTNGKTEGKHCSVCDTVLVAQTNIPASHTSGEWITDVNATCTQKGSKHQICAVCATTIKTEAIAAKGHSYNTETTPPTHTEKGFTTFTCSCGYTYIDNYVNALGHNYNTSITNKTASTNATITYICSCGDTYTEEISPIKISFVCTGTSSATINGYGTYTRHYSIGTTGGYGSIKFKYELFTTSTATTPTDTIDFTSSTKYSLSSRGYSFSAGNYVVKITAKDNYGNVSVYRFKLSDESILDYEII